MFALELNSNRKGAIAEAEITAAAVRCGVPVLTPVSEHGRYDLAFELAGRLHRVQCKWGGVDRDESVIVVRIGCSTYTPNGYVTSTYAEDEIDLLAVHCGELDRNFLLPARLVAGRRSIQLRLTPPLNAQRASINLAADFEFDGAVAQLERAFGWQPKGQGFESPQLHSLDSRAPHHEVGAHEFRNHFGYFMERAAAGEEILIRRRGRPHARLGPPTDRQQALDVAA